MSRLQSRLQPRTFVTPACKHTHRGHIVPEVCLSVSRGLPRRGRTTLVCGMSCGWLLIRVLEGWILPTQAFLLLCARLVTSPGLWGPGWVWLGAPGSGRKSPLCPAGARWADRSQLSSTLKPFTFHLSHTGVCASFQLWQDDGKPDIGSPTLSNSKKRPFVDAFPKVRSHGWLVGDRNLFTTYLSHRSGFQPVGGSALGGGGGGV